MAQLHVSPGTWVSEGDPLARVVNRENLVLAVGDPAFDAGELTLRLVHLRNGVPVQRLETAEQGRCTCCCGRRRDAVQCLRTPATPALSTGTCRHVVAGFRRTGVAARRGETRQRRAEDADHLRARRARLTTSSELLTLGDLVPGDGVNLEIDLVARYLERMLDQREQEQNS